MFNHLLVVGCFILLGCNTYVTQPIEKLLQNNWIRTPINFDNKQQWIFDGSIMTIADSTIIGKYDYTVDNNLIKDYLYLTPRDSHVVKWDPDIVRWRIIRINKNELYLIGEFLQSSSDTHRSFVVDTN